jgi:hypothetical protein
MRAMFLMVRPCQHLEIAIFYPSNRITGEIRVDGDYRGLRIINTGSDENIKILTYKMIFSLTPYERSNIFLHFYHVKLKTYNINFVYFMPYSLPIILKMKGKAFWKYTICLSVLYVRLSRTFSTSRVWSLYPKYICKMATSSNQQPMGRQLQVRTYSVHLLVYPMSGIKMSHFKMAASHTRRCVKGVRWCGLSPLWKPDFVTE